jgi:hypothetical protein
MRARLVGAIAIVAAVVFVVVFRWAKRQREQPGAAET